MDKSAYISASEIGDYVYCKRGWWLRQKGFLSTTFAMRQGTEKHDNLFLQLIRIKLIQSILLWGGIVLLALLALVLIFM